jgi:methylase of polypeptide subunit release factors
VLEPCCGEGALATVLAAESALKVVGSDLYPELH